jgi:ADP-ribose pyrophosphatase YjhB (NUDIX family)
LTVVALSGGAGRCYASVMASTPPDSPLGPVHRLIPEGDNRERMVCRDCGFIHYQNPKIVVGAIVAWRDQFLLCKRAIEPRRNFWTMPAGYLELNEATAAGAIREAWEEALARITIDGLLAIYDVPRLSQVQVLYRAHLDEPSFAPGAESLDVRLFAWNEIPWRELAFPSVHWALNHYRDGLSSGDFSARSHTA